MATGQPVYNPYQLPTPLIAPRPQQPESSIPTDRLSTQSESLYIASSSGNTTPQPISQPYYPPPNQYTAQPGPSSYQQQAPLPPQQMNYGQSSAPGGYGSGGGGSRMPQQQIPRAGPSSGFYAQQQPPQQQAPPQRRGALSEGVPQSFDFQGNVPSPPSQYGGGGSGGYFQQPSPNGGDNSHPYNAGGNHHLPSPNLPSLSSLSLYPPQNKRPSYYSSPEEGPPHKLSVVHPDHKTLATLRDRAMAGDMGMKVAWSKQVLKFIERHQSTAGESSRINDPLLVRWTDEALNHILNSASSTTPVPLALYLRGDLSSSGSFPSYRPKDPKCAFRDFEAAANLGYEKSWFRIGRAYEEFGDLRRSVGAYEKGVECRDCGSTYRLAMAYLLGQIGVERDYKKGVALLGRAAEGSDLDTPQPPYILGMLLTGEFESPAVQLPKDLVPVNLEEAKWRIERAAFLSFGPAQYKMGFSYEYASLNCPFDPLLSVQYYALASQNGEIEADMALSKWYLCGSVGHFVKNEQLAVTFAEKAAGRGLPAAEFALGYYKEVGINGSRDLEVAKKWYARVSFSRGQTVVARARIDKFSPHHLLPQFDQAASHGNLDAQDRITALASSETNMLSRTDHEKQIDTKLVRKRTQAQERSDRQREEVEARNLAISLASGQLVGSGNSTSPRPFRGSGGNEGGNGRPISNDSQAAIKLRRRDTMRQVEVAAVMNMMESNGLSGNGGGPRGSHSSSTSSGQYNAANGGRGGSTSSNSQSPLAPNQRNPNLNQNSRAGYSLSDTPASRTGGGASPIAGAGQGKNSIPDRKKPETFADMGIVTQKAKKDECSIM